MSLLETTDDGRTNMGLSFGLAPSILNPKLKNRWMFSIPKVSANKNSVTSLPPRKGGRPGINFKEFDFQHIHETIYYPLKAEWKVVNLTLYDIRCNDNAVFDWLQNIYITTSDLKDTGTPNFAPVLNLDFLRDATLELYDGCGNVAETWTLQRCYPQSIDWGELDMDSADLVVVDIALRYQRAFFKKI